MDMSVVIVDDSEVDRFMIKRRLLEAQDFGDVVEIAAGDIFLEEYFSAPSASVDAQKLLVLMDINMPRLTGFDTIAQMQERLADGKGPTDCIVLILTSSDNPDDIKMADMFDIVEGYIVKPVGRADVDLIRSVYEERLAA
ncbi:MAG: response regulator [Pseudomonadota bacterium]